MTHCNCCAVGRKEREDRERREKETLKNPSMYWRRFEYSDYLSDKFWEIKKDYDPTVVWIRYGKIGTKGTLIKKEFSWTYEANRFYTEKVTEKLNKGYEFSR